MSEQTSVVQLFAERYNLKKDTLFPLLQMIAPQGATEDDILGFLLIAYRFDLDPWAKEIYLIKGKGGRVQPYISLDGYARIANRQQEYDGCEFSYQQNAEGQITACTCTMYRRDRTHPVVVTEFFHECVQYDREGKMTPAWDRTPSRMLRTRAFTQAVRLCFGVSAALAEEEIEFQSGPSINMIEERKQMNPSLPDSRGEQAVPMAKTGNGKRVAPSPSRQKEQPKDEEKKGGHAADLKDTAAVSAEHDKYLGELNDALGDGGSEDEVKAIYTEWAPELALRGSPASMDRAADLLLKHIRRTEHS